MAADDARSGTSSAAFFDLDKTLIQGSSAFQFGRAAYRAGLLGRRQLLADAFANVPVDTAGARLVALMEQYRPQVVVTYDADGGYGHPDHIQAHRITVAAVDACGIPDKLYYAAFPRSAFARFAERLREAGIDPEEVGVTPPDDRDEAPPFGVPDEVIDAVVDVSDYVEAKRDALMAHASQTDNSFFNRMPIEGFRLAFANESFIRARAQGAVEGIEVDGLEDDLFNGLR